MSARNHLKSILQQPLTQDPEAILIDDDEDQEEVDEGYRAEYGDNFYYEDENGFWAPNTDFNSDGLPIDENGDVIDEEDCRFQDDFDYSKFYEPPEDDDEILKAASKSKNSKNLGASLKSDDLKRSK